MSPDNLAFLIDECLHPRLADLANEFGFSAYHVDRLGLKGVPDLHLLQRAISEYLILVTNNAIDFRKLYAGAAIHSGLILILPMVRPSEQRILFQAVLLALKGRADLVNRIIEVDRTGDTVVIREFQLPSQ